MTATAWQLPRRGPALWHALKVALHESVGLTPVGLFHNAGFKLGRWHDVGWWECSLASPAPDPAPPRPFSG